MPTAYTQPIYDGQEISFDQFALRCARAFGALVMLRDEPLDEPLPSSLEPAPFYSEKLKEIESELQALNQMTEDEASKKAKKEYRKAQKRHKENIARATAMKAQYEDMIEKVKSWQAPSPDHQGLKDYMLQQLTDSLKSDCGTTFFQRKLNEPLLTGSQWLGQRYETLNKDLAYYRNSYAEEVERVAGRNLWLSQLRESLS